MSVQVNLNVEVEYMIDGVVVHTSATNPTFPLAVEVMTHTAGAVVKDLAWLTACHACLQICKTYASVK